MGSLAASADAITSQQEFAIIEHDPVIEFSLGDLSRLSSTAVSYELLLVLTDEQADSITAAFTDDAGSTTLKAQSTAEASDVELSADYDKSTDTTTITTILPGKVLNGYSFIQKIPKCLENNICKNYFFL